jgi:hypothetical protein
MSFSSLVRPERLGCRGFCAMAFMMDRFGIVYNRFIAAIAAEQSCLNYIYLAVIGASPELMRAPNKSRINSTAPWYEPWPIRVKPSINWRSHILLIGSSNNTASSGALAALTGFSRWHDRQLKHLESA